jgi:hypothetical protein
MKPDYNFAYLIIKLCFIFLVGSLVVKFYSMLIAFVH